MNVFKLLLKIGGWLWVAFAIVDLVISFFLYRHTRNFIQSASRAPGTVIKLIERSGHDSGKYYYPVYTFHDSQEKEHEIYSSSGSFPPAYAVGQKVTVLYQSGQPEKARLDSFSDLWLWTTLLGGFGIVGLVVGLSMLLVVIIIGRYQQRPPVIRVA